MAAPLIFGINDGYAASVTVLEDGEVRFNAAEERFNKQKNYGGVPELTLRWLMEEEGTGLQNAEAIGVAWKSEPFRSISSFRKSKHKFFALLSRIFPSRLMGSDALIQCAIKLSASRRAQLQELKPVLGKFEAKDKAVWIFDHHQCHAAASLYASGFLKRYPEVLTMTLDGSGDGESMTVWRATAHGMQKLASQNSYHSLGILVARLTQLMGMKPLEHEYKIMGMAPYAEGSHSSQKAYKILSRYFTLDPSGLRLVNRMGAWGEAMVRRLHKDLFQIRFDAVSYGIQRLVEDLCSQLVLNWVRHTGIRYVTVGGGMFMNIKLNMVLAQHPEIEDFFALPSCGDDSLALGAAYLAQETYRRGSSQGIQGLYWGKRVTAQEIAACLGRYRGEIEYKVCEDIERETAVLLTQDRIIGRVRGRAEWGARALGNRSILCNPSKAQNIHRINRAVKKRDFWMPFCPSILDDFESRYLVNHRHRPAHYMALAFESKEDARRDIICGLHPFDFTARPQVVTKQMNSQFHQLLTHFKEMTGIGGIVNTSFNLHGLPIVNSAEDAIHVLLNSEIDFVTLEDHLIWKRR